MQQDERESVENPKSQRKEVPVEECFDGHARITSKELAPIHSVKSGTLQNASSTRPRVVADLGKSALMHIVRLMNRPGKRSKKNDDKSAVAMLKKHELYDRTGKPVFALTHVTSTTDLLCATHQVHDNWVASFRIWSRRSCHQSYGRAQTCRNQSNVKFTKDIARHAKTQD